VCWIVEEIPGGFGVSSKRRANKSVEANRRPATPFAAEGQFGSASCAPAFLSAVVAHLIVRCLRLLFGPGAGTLRP
jgi:hypothetical protein